MRRFCAVSATSALLVIAVWLLGKYVNRLDFYLSNIDLIFAAITLLASLIFRFVAKYKYTKPKFIILFVINLLFSVLLIYSQNNLFSALSVIWMSLAFFSGMLGISGIAALVLSANGLILYFYQKVGLSNSQLLSSVVIYEFPILISYVIWNRGSGGLRVAIKKANLVEKIPEEELHKTASIIQSISEGLITINQLGHITLMNNSAAKLTGWAQNDATGIDYESVIKLENQSGQAIQTADNPIYQTLNTNQENHSSELVLAPKHGKKINVLLSATPYGDEEDGAVIVIRNITEERAREREQMEFINTASHEMRTPVAAIQGYLGLVLNPKISQIDNKAREYITKAEDESNNLGQLLQDLLDISRAEDGRLESKPEPFEAVEVTRSAIEGLIPKAAEKGLKVIYQPDGTKAETGIKTIAPVFFVNTDRHRFVEVVMNLFENALKYTPSGSIKVDVDQKDNYVRVSVTDSGIGIPPEDIGHIFQKFYRVDNSDTREIGGTGLGLYLCKKLVESMDGYIGVNSKQGEGSTFYIDIPRIDRPEYEALLKDFEEHKRTDLSQIKDESQSGEQDVNQNLNSGSAQNISQNLSENMAQTTIQNSTQNFGQTPTGNPAQIPSQNQFVSQNQIINNTSRQTLAQPVVQNQISQPQLPPKPNPVFAASNFQAPAANPVSNSQSKNQSVKPQTQFKPQLVNSQIPKPTPSVLTNSQIPAKNSIIQPKPPIPAKNPIPQPNISAKTNVSQSKPGSSQASLIPPGLVNQNYSVYRPRPTAKNTAPTSQPKPAAPVQTIKPKINQPKTQTFQSNISQPQPIRPRPVKSPIKQTVPIKQSGPLIRPKPVLNQTNPTAVYQKPTQNEAIRPTQNINK